MKITLDRLLNKLNREVAVRLLQRRNNPAFMIIGAQKAATSSLAYYLNQHPRFEISKNKEVHFFDRDDNFSRGLKWYQQQFVRQIDYKPDTLFFEATPDYAYRESAMEKIFNYYPDIKFIFILRNPIDRAFSAWNMYRDFSTWKKMPKILYTGYLYGKANNIYKQFFTRQTFPEFEECVRMELSIINSNIDQEEPGLLRRGLYLNQLKRIYNFFPKKNVLILGFKDVVNDNAGTLNKILSFLNIEHSTWNFLEKETINSRSYHVRLKAETRHLLENFYANYNQDLFSELGFKPNW